MAGSVYPSTPGSATVTVRGSAPGTRWPARMVSGVLCSALFWSGQRSVREGPLPYLDSLNGARWVHVVATFYFLPHAHLLEPSKEWFHLTRRHTHVHHGTRSQEDSDITHNAGRNLAGKKGPAFLVSLCRFERCHYITTARHQGVDFLLGGPWSRGRWHCLLSLLGYFLPRHAQSLSVSLV